jgi:cell division protein FtsB
MDQPMKHKHSPRGAQRKGSATARARQADRGSDPASMTFAQQMRDFLRRNSTWFLVTGLIFLVLQDIFGTHGVLAMRRSQQQAVEIQKEIQQLNTENQKLQDRVKALKTDPSTIERIAREEMGLARPGEYIFKIQPKPGEPSTPLAQPAEPPRKP